MSKEAEPLFTIALDKCGNAVSIKDAVKGIDYFCPECGAKFALKKSGKTGPHSRRPHFAHLGHGYNCTPESILHKAFKTQAAKLLEQYLVEKKEFLIEWSCSHCPAKYKGNLLFAAASVAVEKDLGTCQPDIAILDKDGKVIIVIEVVVTHEPEQTALDYYKENGIVMVRVDVDEDDLQNIEAKLSNPNAVTLCLHTRCEDFSLNNHTRKVETINRKCKKCGKEFQKLGVQCSTAVGIYGRSVDLTQQEEIELRSRYSNRPNIQMWISKVYDREVTVPGTRCGCESLPIKRSTPSQYYYDSKSGRYKKKWRL